MCSGNPVSVINKCKNLHLYKPIADYLVEFAVGVFGNELGLLELAFQEGQPLLICQAAAFQGLAVSEEER